MEKLSTVVRVEKILVADFQVDRESRATDCKRVGASAAGWIVRLEQRRVTIFAEQLARTADRVMESIARTDLRVAKAGFEQRLDCGHRRKMIRTRKRNLETAVAAHRDSRNESGGFVLAGVVPVTKVLEEILRNQSLP